MSTSAWQRRIRGLGQQLQPLSCEAMPTTFSPIAPDPPELEVRPLEVGEHGGGFGAQVLNLDLHLCSKETVTEKLGPLVKKWGLVLVRGASTEAMHGEKHAQIATWLSPSGGLYLEHAMHKEQHLPFVFRLSNRKEEGVLGGGPGLWHHDSLHLPEVPPFSVLHMFKAPSLDEGAVCAATWFARADASKLSPEVKTRLLRLQAMHLPTGQLRPILNSETDTLLPPTRVGVLEVDDQGNGRKLQAEELRQLLEFYQRLLIKGEVTSLPTPPKGNEAPPSPRDQKWMSENELAALSRKLEKEALEAGRGRSTATSGSPGTSLSRTIRRWRTEHRPLRSETTPQEYGCCIASLRSPMWEGHGRVDRVEIVPCSMQLPCFSLSWGVVRMSGLTTHACPRAPPGDGCALISLPPCPAWGWKGRGGVHHRA